MPVFTPQQEAALKAVSRWLKDRPGSPGCPQVFRLFGYAGTGKTTLARHIAQDVQGRVLYAAFTGKAALVMRAKGCEGATTIHSLIYRPTDPNAETPTFTLHEDSPAAGARLIVIDECSMVDAELGRDLMSFGAPVLVLGDPAQLPPIQGGGYFTEHEPDAMLTEVHRQARDDPIVRLSMDIRDGRRLEPGQYGRSQVVRRSSLDPERVLQADQVLVGRNATRRAYNARLRSLRGLDGPLPQAGDKLVALRNNKRKGLFNGSLWTVASARARKSGVMSMRITPEDEVGAKAMRVSTRAECFTGGIEDLPWDSRRRHDEFDFGYVLTVHKAQGSQWDDVVLFDESFAFPETAARWLYTGVTRAARRLTVVI